MTECTLRFEDATMVATSDDNGARLSIHFANGASVVEHVRRPFDGEHGEGWCRWVAETKWTAPGGIRCYTGRGFFASRDAAAEVSAGMVAEFMPMGEYPTAWALAEERHSWPELFRRDHDLSWMHRVVRVEQTEDSVLVKVRGSAGDLMVFIYQTEPDVDASDRSGWAVDVDRGNMPVCGGQRIFDDRNAAAKEATHMLLSHLREACA